MILRIPAVFLSTSLLISKATKSQAKYFEFLREIFCGDRKECEAWTEAIIDGQIAGEATGTGIAMSNDHKRLAVGAPNQSSMRVFDWDGSKWDQVGDTIVSDSPSDKFGGSVTMSGDGNRIAIGTTVSLFNIVRVYDWNGSSWVQAGNDIGPEYPGDTRNGWALDISEDGSRLVVGAPHNTEAGFRSGHVRVYEYNLGDWVKIGQDIDGHAYGDRFGWSVSISSDGNRIAAGSLFNEGTGAWAAGHVRIYDWTGTAWTQAGQDLDGTRLDARFGEAIDLSDSGNRIAIGEPWQQTGWISVYEWNEDTATWVKMGATIDGPSSGAQWGRMVELSGDGNRLIGTGTAAGFVAVYDWDGTAWNQVFQETKDGRGFGRSLAISPDGSYMAIASPYFDGYTGNVEFLCME